MKRIFTLILFVAAVYSASAQTYSTGHRTQTFIDNSRSAREVPTELYYPANTAGNNVALATGSAKFPVVVFGHGFLIASSSYKWLADSLVKTGYIVAFPTTEEGLIPSHLDFGLDLAFLCGRITSLNDSSTSFLYQRVIKKAAVAGHSMGGGASFLAAATQPSSVKAVFNFAAAETTPPASAAALLDFKPTLVFSGSSDCIAPDTVQQKMYNSIFLACKTYIDITNGLHCQFANNNLICSAGQLASGCPFTSLSTSALLTKTMSLLSPFLDYYLKGICTRGEAFVFTYNNITGVTKQRSCLPVAACGPVPITLASFTGEVRSNKVNLYWNTVTEENVSNIVVERSYNGTSFNQLTSVLPKANNGTGASYSTVDPYPFSGINYYRLKTIDKDGTVSYSETIKLVTAKKNLAVTQFYPNPVDDVLHIQLQSDKHQAVTLTVFDITGKQLQSVSVQLNNGMNEQNLPFINLSKGAYIIQYKDEKGENTGTFKVFKN